MENFNYYAPTKVVFGKDTEQQVGALVKEQGSMSDHDTSEISDSQWLCGYYDAYDGALFYTGRANGIDRPLL